MINERNAKRFCCEDVSKIENYEKALASAELWDVHHRGEIIPCGRFSRSDLKNYGLYYGRPASELVFLSHAEHMSLHASNPTKDRSWRNALARIGNKYRKGRGTRRVEQVKDGKVVATFASLTEAAAKTGANLNHICDACRGRKQSAGGYKWRYG